MEMGTECMEIGEWQGISFRDCSDLEMGTVCYMGQGFNQV